MADMSCVHHISSRIRAEEANTNVPRIPAGPGSDLEVNCLDLGHNLTVIVGRPNRQPLGSDLFNVLEPAHAEVVLNAGVL